MTVWPRMLKRKTAAAYCDLSEAAFEREISLGTLPAPDSLERRIARIEAVLAKVEARHG